MGLDYKCRFIHNSKELYLSRQDFVKLKKNFESNLQGTLKVN